MPVAQQVAQAGQEGVAVPHLGRAPAIPPEGGVGIRRERGGISLEHRDLVPGPSEAQGGAEPGHPCADHHHLRHRAKLDHAVKSRQISTRRLRVLIVGA